MNLEELRTSNYVRTSKKSNNYWVSFFSKKMSKYIDTYGEGFNLIIYAGEDSNEGYYIIPFGEVKEFFIEKNLSKDKGNIKRWVATIKNHILKINNCSTDIDIKDYFMSKIYLEPDILEDNYSSDYYIENYRQEINIRIKQNVFREKVLKRFNNACCITNITEKDLLVASHIIPWSHNKSTRLDPLNGLCLSILYDKLFDRGYFTINSDLEITTIKFTAELSPSLHEILLAINGKKISLCGNEIPKEYLKYHRDNIFMDRVKILSKC
ncbi:HNH endonuclease [Siphonobacter curvatus]|uniref:HNH nuclease domain-containing protein n=1 Tax=Siphonobacter curvatus TaxID=2094562 RepID=A0A2S7IR40_9BACT|nr:HNH endonuclease [Siphonobacter curvatus]PQA60146.1 hypothetical protein C5O19_11165 [Siphonobacter curvatus]